jgi:hypothetical protein
MSNFDDRVKIENGLQPPNKMLGGNTNDKAKAKAAAEGQAEKVKDKKEGE